MLSRLARLARLGTWTVAAPAAPVVWSPELVGLLAGAPDGTLPFAAGEEGRLAAAVERAFAAGADLDLELQLLGSDGSVSFLRVRGEPCRAGDGRGMTLAGYAQDVTASKLAEQALAEVAHQLEEAQRVAQLGTYRLDIASGQWTSSAILDTLFGIAHLPGPHPVARWVEIVHPDERDDMLAYFQNEVVGRRRPFDREYRIVRLDDGAVCWVHGRGELTLGDDGRPLAMIGTIRDITARRRAEEERRASEVLYHDLVETAQDLIWMCDGEGRYVYLNAAFEEVFGYRVEEMLGRPFTDFQSAETAARDREAFARLLQAGSVRGFETIHQACDGRPIHLVFNAKVLVDAGGSVIGTRGTAYDITSRRQAEAAKLELERRLLHAQKLESLGLLAGGIAHDFNNLLMAVIGNLDLALLTLPEETPARDSIEHALQAAHHSTDLTRQMLAYSGRGSFLVEDLDLAALVADNVALLRATIGKNVVLEVASQPDLPLVHADAAQVQQVVMNLITNAAEAVGPGEGTIAVNTGSDLYDAATLVASRIDERPLPGRFVWLEVRDSGCGMDEATLARLFDPFFTTKASGRGLGLSAVLGIVRGHGGAITVRSAPSEGTVIRVLFPVAERDDRAPTEPIQAPRRREHHDEVGGRRGTILVVDDEEAVRSLVRRMLERLGFAVLEAADGAEAEGVFRDYHPSLACVVLDLSMPRVDGVAALARLRAIDPEARVILASGFDRDDSLRRFERERPTTFIHKPFRFTQLRSVLASVLDADFEA